MRILRSILRLLMVTIASLALATSAMSPASAASWGPTNIYSTGGTLIASASWSDGTDTLCVTERVNWTVYVHLKRASTGEPDFIWTIPGSRNSQWCSGNLSVPEDVQFRLTMSNNGTIQSPAKYFYS